MDELPDSFRLLENQFRLTEKMIVWRRAEPTLAPQMKTKSPVVFGLLVAVVLLVGFASSAEAGRRGTHEVPPPGVIDRTVVTPVVSGL